MSRAKALRPGDCRSAIGLPRITVKLRYGTRRSGQSQPLSEVLASWRTPSRNAASRARQAALLEEPWRNGAFRPCSSCAWQVLAPLVREGKALVTSAGVSVARNWESDDAPGMRCTWRRARNGRSAAGLPGWQASPTQLELLRLVPRRCACVARPSPCRAGTAPGLQALALVLGF